MEDCESVQGDRDEKTDKGGNTSEAMWPRKCDFQIKEYHFPEGKPAMHFLYMKTYGDGASSPSRSPAVRGLHLEEAQLLVLK